MHFRGAKVDAAAGSATLAQRERAFADRRSTLCWLGRRRPNADVRLGRGRCLSDPCPRNSHLLPVIPGTTGKDRVVVWPIRFRLFQRRVCVTRSSNGCKAVTMVTMDFRLGVPGARTSSRLTGVSAVVDVIMTIHVSRGGISAIPVW